MTHTTAFKRYALTLAIIGSSFVLASALTISPARTELTADPGKTVDGEFLLINDQDTDQTFYTSAENFEAQGETGTPNFVQSDDGLASWIRVEDKVTLKKGERMKVPFTIKVPTDADAGGHFAAIFLSTNPPSAKGGEVAVGAKVGMLVLLKVTGDVKEGGGVLSFSLKNNAHLVTTLPVQFMYRFNNSGNDRVNPTGEIVIRDTIGLTADRLNPNPSVGNVLPNSTRRFEVTWGKEAPLPDSASFWDFVGYEARNFALGIYNAKLNLSFGTSGNAVMSTTFFVFPWHLMTVVFVILVILYFVFRSLIKRYNRWIINQARLAQGQ